MMKTHVKEPGQPRMRLVVSYVWYTGDVEGAVVAAGDRN